MPDKVCMRAILIGSDRDRDRLRWQLRDTGLIIVGECATTADARDSGIECDVFLLTPEELLERPGPVEPQPLVALDALEALDALTPRELEVLGRLADGLPNKAIAAELGISDQTVKFHVAQIIAKLGVANRTEAVRRAIRRGLIAV